MGRAMRFRFWSLIGIFCLPGVLSADYLYMLRDLEDELIRVEIDSLMIEVIGPIDFQSSSSGMAWHPGFNKLLVARIDPSSTDKNPDFYFVNPQTAETEHLGSINLGVSTGWRAGGLAIDPDSGRIFLGHARSIFEIDLDNLSANEIGSLPGELSPEDPEDRVSLDSLTFDSKNHRLISASGNLDINPKIFSIDPESGEIDLICTIVLPAGYSTFNDDWLGFHSGGLAYDPIRDVFWRAGRYEPLLRLEVGEECLYSVREEILVTTEAVALVPSFKINPGMNDAWYNPDTNGQGILISVFPDIQKMFAAWFTFDTERPPDNVSATIGEPGHRWLTAFGPYSGDTATLTIEVTEGGVFDASDPPAHNDGVGDGTMTIEFADCTEALVTYEIDSPGVSGEIPIQRVADDNVALCEALANQ